MKSYLRKGELNQNNGEAILMKSKIQPKFQNRRENNISYNKDNNRKVSLESNISEKIKINNSNLAIPSKIKIINLDSKNNISKQSTFQKRYDNSSNYLNINNRKIKLDENSDLKAKDKQKNNEEIIRRIQEKYYAPSKSPKSSKTNDSHETMASAKIKTIKISNQNNDNSTSKKILKYTENYSNSNDKKKIDNENKKRNYYNYQNKNNIPDNISYKYNKRIEDKKEIYSKKNKEAEPIGYSTENFIQKNNPQIYTSKRLIKNNTENNLKISGNDNNLNISPKRIRTHFKYMTNIKDVNNRNNNTSSTTNIPRTNYSQNVYNRTEKKTKEYNLDNNKNYSEKKNNNYKYNFNNNINDSNNYSNNNKNYIKINKTEIKSVRNNKVNEPKNEGLNINKRINNNIRSTDQNKYNNNYYSNSNINKNSTRKIIEINNNKFNTTSITNSNSNIQNNYNYNNNNRGSNLSFYNKTNQKTNTYTDCNINNAPRIEHKILNRRNVISNRNINLNTNLQNKPVENQNNINNDKNDVKYNRYNQIYKKLTNNDKNDDIKDSKENNEKKPTIRYNYVKKTKENINDKKYLNNLDNKKEKEKEKDDKTKVIDKNYSYKRKYNTDKEEKEKEKDDETKVNNKKYSYRRQYNTYKEEKYNTCKEEKDNENKNKVDDKNYIRKYYINRNEKDKKNDINKNDKPLEVNKVLEENKKVKTVYNINKKKEEINKNQQKETKKEEKYKKFQRNKNKKENNETEKNFLIKNFFKMFKSRVNNQDNQYARWFKRNCDNNNDVSKKKDNTAYIYNSRRIRNYKDKVQEMPYDEWFNRNCEKNENVIKKQKKENERKSLLYKLKNILMNENKKVDTLNNELNKLNNEEQKDILNDLKNCINDKLKKIEIKNLIDKYGQKEKEKEKNKLLKGVKDKETKEKMTNLFNLWDNNSSLSKNDKIKIFEKINDLFKKNKVKKNTELIEELNKLEKNDKNEAIDYLKDKNKNKINEIDEIKNLSEKKKKLDVLVNILGGKKDNKSTKKEKLNKIVDILLNLDKKTKRECVNYMKNTAEDDEEKNDDLNDIMGNITYESKEESFELENDEDYSYSKSNSSFSKNLDTNSRLNADEIKISDELKLSNISGEFQLLDDDIFEIINEIQNSEENPKKLLAEDEFKDMADNLIENLYDNKNNNFAENEEDLKKIINSLNDMNHKDKIKTVDLLRQSADDENKKKIFSKLKNKMMNINNTKKLIKGILDKKNKEEEKIENITSNLFEELDSDETVYLDENNNNDEKKKIEDDKINKAVEKINDIGEDNPKILIEKLKNNLKYSGKKKSVHKFFKQMSYLNKMKKFSIEVKNKNNNKTFSFNDGTFAENNSIVENLEKKDFNEILKGFEKDLFEEKQKPLSRKEERENDKDEKKKLTEVAKVICEMNEKDQEKILSKLNIKANDEYKKSQINKLDKLIKDTKIVKSFFERLKNNKRYKEDKNEGENTKNITEKKLKEMANDIARDLFQDNNTEDIEEENLENAVQIINELDKNQQKQIIDILESKAKSKENQETFKKLLDNLTETNRFKNLIKSIGIRSSISKKNHNIEDKNEDRIEEKKEINKKELNINLDDKDLVNIVEAVVTNLFSTSNKERKNEELYVKDVDKYLQKKEKENKINRASIILNNLKNEDKQRISAILTYIIDNDEQSKDIKKLNKNIGVTDIENKNNGLGTTIIEKFNNDDSEEELKEDKLIELTEQLMTELMKDYKPEEKDEKTENLNKAANTILNLNKKDQEKILDTLNNLAKSDNQKETIGKLNKLVEYLNYMRFYLYSINQNHLSKNKNINENEFKDIKKNVVSSIFKEEDEFEYEKLIKTNDDDNINKAALKMSTLSLDRQNQILKELNQKSIESNDINAIKSIEKLNNILKGMQLVKIFSNLIKGRSTTQKKKQLCDNEIQEFADNINNVLKENKNPTNFTEKLLVSKNKEHKINQLAKSIKLFDEESKKKAMNYLSKNIINDSHKTNINKLRDSIMNLNNNDERFNLLASQFFIKSLGRTPLNDDELSLLTDSFSRDLFNEQINDENLKEDNLNLLANVIKELDEDNQNKVMEKLENMPQAKNKESLIENLRERIQRLNLLKDELKDEKIDLIEQMETVDFDNNNEGIRELRSDEILENIEDPNETVSVEISVDDINQEDIKELCQVFNVYYEIENDKEKEKIKKSINLSKNIKKYVNKTINLNRGVNMLARSLVKFNNKTQKKITESLGENLRNENEKKQLTQLMKKIYELNSYKKFGKEIKQRKKERKKNFDEEIKNIERLSRNSTKNLEKEQLDNLEKEIINDLYSEPKVDFDKNEEIRIYLLDTINEQKIKNSAEKINILSPNDRKIILETIQKAADNEEKKNKYNKVYNIIDNLQKIKEINDVIKNKEKTIQNNDKNNLKLSEKLSEDKLQILAKNFAKSLFEQNPEKSKNYELFIKTSEKINSLSQNNQDFILNILKKRADNDEKKYILGQFGKVLDNLSKSKSFLRRVKEKHLQKTILDKLVNEKKYGIVVLPNGEEVDKNNPIIKRIPTELNEDKFQNLLYIFIDDLKKINEEENNYDDISPINKYKKEKENETKIEEIAVVINSLNTNDKNKALEEIKKCFDIPKKNSFYNKFMKIYLKKERQFQDEVKKKLEEAKKEIKEENNGLYGNIEENNEDNNNNN